MWPVVCRIERIRGAIPPVTEKTSGVKVERSTSNIRFAYALLDLEICRGGVNSDTFRNFITQRLLVHLYPFTNDNPQSVVILDNCTIHHTRNALVLYMN